MWPTPADFEDDDDDDWTDCDCPGCLDDEGDEESNDWFEDDLDEDCNCGCGCPYC